MIKVYYRKVFSHLEEDAFLRLLTKVEAGRREKILKLKGEEQQMRSLAAGCLLHDALCERLGCSPKKQGAFLVAYGEKGKPYLPGYPHIHFNLSHSGEYVCCGVGDMPVGVDIQQKISTDTEQGSRQSALMLPKRLAERFFTQEDKRRLRECADKDEWNDLFFRMWSIKEGYGKLTGAGIAEGLSGFEIDWERNAVAERKGKEPSAYFAELDKLMGYSFCLCTRDWGQEIKWEES